MTPTRVLRVVRESVGFRLAELESSGHGDDDCWDDDFLAALPGPFAVERAKVTCFLRPEGREAFVVVDADGQHGHVVVDAEGFPIEAPDGAALPAALAGPMRLMLVTRGAEESLALARVLFTCSPNAFVERYPCAKDALFALAREPERATVLFATLDAVAELAAARELYPSVMIAALVGDPFDLPAVLTATGHGVVDVIPWPWASYMQRRVDEPLAELRRRALEKPKGRGLRAPQISAVETVIRAAGPASVPSPDGSFADACSRLEVVSACLIVEADTCLRFGEPGRAREMLVEAAAYAELTGRWKQLGGESAWSESIDEAAALWAVAALPSRALALLEELPATDASRAVRRAAYAAGIDDPAFVANASSRALATIGAAPGEVSIAAVLGLLASLAHSEVCMAILSSTREELVRIARRLTANLEPANTEKAAASCLGAARSLCLAAALTPSDDEERMVEAWAQAAGLLGDLGEHWKLRRLLDASVVPLHHRFVAERRVMLLCRDVERVSATLVPGLCAYGYRVDLVASKEGVEPHYDGVPAVVAATNEWFESVGTAANHSAVRKALQTRFSVPFIVRMGAESGPDALVARTCRCLLLEALSAGELRRVWNQESSVEISVGPLGVKAALLALRRAVDDGSAIHVENAALNLDTEIARDAHARKYFGASLSGPLSAQARKLQNGSPEKAYHLFRFIVEHTIKDKTGDLVTLAVLQGQLGTFKCQAPGNDYLERAWEGYQALVENNRTDKLRADLASDLFRLRARRAFIAGADPAEIVRLAEQAIVASERALAAGTDNAILRVTKRRAEAWWLKGKALLALGRGEAATAAAAAAVEQATRAEADYWIGRGHALAVAALRRSHADAAAIRRHAGAAEEAFRACVERRPEDVSAFEELAMLFAEQGQLAEAVEVLDKARAIQANRTGRSLEDRKRSVDWLEFSCAELLFRFGYAYEAAKRFLELLATTQPDNFLAAQRLATVLRDPDMDPGQLSDLVRRIAAQFTRAETTNAQDSVASFVLAEEQRDVDDKGTLEQRAQQYFDRATTEADAELQRLMLEHAIVLTEAQVRSDPTMRDPIPWTRLGRALLRRGQAEDALRIFQRLQLAHPEDEYVPFFIGQCLIATGSFAESIPFFQQAWLRTQRIETAYRLAFAYRSIRQPTKAAAWLAHGLEKHPADALANYAIGYVLLELGDRAGAINHLRTALRSAAAITEVTSVSWNPASSVGRRAARALVSDEARPLGGIDDMLALLREEEPPVASLLVDQLAATACFEEEIAAPLLVSLVNQPLSVARRIAQYAMSRAIFATMGLVPSTDRSLWVRQFAEAVARFDDDLRMQLIAEFLAGAKGSYRRALRRAMRALLDADDVTRRGLQLRLAAITARSTWAPAALSAWAPVLDYVTTAANDPVYYRETLRLIRNIGAARPDELDAYVEQQIGVLLQKALRELGTDLEPLSREDGDRGQMLAATGSIASRLRGSATLWRVEDLRFGARTAATDNRLIWIDEEACALAVALLQGPGGRAAMITRDDGTLVLGLERAVARPDPRVQASAKRLISSLHGYLEPVGQRWDIILPAHALIDVGL